jgi:hypothetical protein
MRKEVMILSGKYLRLVDQDGDVYLQLDRADVSELARSLMYTINYRPEEYPEYDTLQAALYDFLGAS